MITNPIRIISEEASKALEPRFKAFSDFISDHSGEDLVRYLHAQDVEIVTHTNGALLKCYRTEERDTSDPGACWRFWTGQYEIDQNHLDDEGDVMYGAGFSQQNLIHPINYILSQTKNGRLNKIDPGTLIVFQVGKTEPDVRAHDTEPKANMVVVGVKYDVPEDTIAELLSSPGDIEAQAIKWSSRWESHNQLEKVAAVMGTDSTPLLFRGRLNNPADTVDGMRRSAEDDRTFSQIVGDFLGQAGENPTEKDYERFFRHALRRFDDFEIRRLDKQGKIADATTVTKDTYKDLADKFFRRYEDVSKEVDGTIDEFGRDSQEHIDDYRDLNYLSNWIREKVPEYLFADQEHDPITIAIHSLKEIRPQVDETSVILWVRRYLEENGVHDALYKDHIKDERVPQARHTGRNVLWEMFMRELTRFVQPRLADLIADAT